MVIVQLVVVRWTKESRGAPGATVRNAVPEAFRLPAPPPGTDAAALLGWVTADEADGFAIDAGPLSAMDLPLTAEQVRVEPADDGSVSVVRGRNRFRGFPPLEHERRAFTLLPGTWGQLVRNNRLGGAHEWTYTKTVANVANLGAVDRDVFVASEPSARLDEQVDLW